MGIRKITATYPVTGETYRDSAGCCEATVLRNVTDTSGNMHTVFENRSGVVNAYSVEDFKATYFEVAKHDLKPGDIFQISKEKSSGNAGKDIFFLFLDDDKVIRIGSNWNFSGDTSSAELDYYVTDIANGDYKAISRVNGVNTYGYKVAK